MLLKLRDDEVWRPVPTTLHLGRCWWVPGGPIWALVLDAVYGSVRTTFAFSLSQGTKTC